MDFPAPDTPIRTIINKPLYAAVSYLSASSDSSSMTLDFRPRAGLISKIRSMGA